MFFVVISTFMYVATEVTCVCFYLYCVHDILRQSENTKYIHEYCLRICH